MGSHLATGPPGRPVLARPGARFHLPSGLGRPGANSGPCIECKGLQRAFDLSSFDADTFWNFKRTAELFGAKYPAPPLGMITLAALLPRFWSLRLVNRNTEQLSDDDLDWADLVLTGGMLPQQNDTLDVVDLCRARGKPVVVGGPGVTSSPHLYQTANFRVLGEAEGVIDKFVEAWEAGAREGQFEAEKFQVDVSKTRSPLRPPEI